MIDDRQIDRGVGVVQEKWPENEQPLDWQQACQKQEPEDSDTSFKWLETTTLNLAPS